MMFTATTDDGRKVTWDRGALTGDPSLVAIVHAYVDEQALCAFDYWGERVATLDTEFVAYLTVGLVLSDVSATDPTFDNVPDNPDGYEPEGLQ